MCGEGGGGVCGDVCHCEVNYSDVCGGIEAPCSRRHCTSTECHIPTAPTLPSLPAGSTSECQGSWRSGHTGWSLPPSPPYMQSGSQLNPLCKYLAHALNICRASGHRLASFPAFGTRETRARGIFPVVSRVPSARKNGKGLGTRLGIGL